MWWPRCAEWTMSAHRRVACLVAAAFCECSWPRARERDASLTPASAQRKRRGAELCHSFVLFVFILTYTHTDIHTSTASAPAHRALTILTPHKSNTICQPTPGRSNPPPPRSLFECNVKSESVAHLCLQCRSKRCARTSGRLMKFRLAAA